MWVLHPSPCFLSAPPETVIPSLQPAKEEWGWVGFQFRPGKGLMTRVWTNGSQWSYLLIQPQYFRSIKYVCLDRSLPPFCPPPDMETWQTAIIYLWQRIEHWELLEVIPGKNWTEKEKIKDYLWQGIPTNWLLQVKKHQIFWFQHWEMRYYLITMLVVLIRRQPNSELKVLYKSEQMADSLQSQLASVSLCAQDRTWQCRYRA